ncbi:1,4-alpha-glucan branching protein [Streptomyces sp. B1866]|uniref:maltokinase N-terminal cap-like domain-containing protein n=1 Tax=Streptomyces sp. B1866 TaxID=3075431 RepID=UPI00288CD955|nr:1,4-alpha-glucan branching protein [Streptomyces sp. B1866]MDT3396944.1 1,4-alpha-glucan branching protein [Streptomyces sp. B1866]
MAFIHHTTLNPGKLELIAPWLPTRPWYATTARDPELTKTGGFRLDDPAGEVGIEIMVVTDTSAGSPVSYQVPLTYRGAPLDGADQALIGTTEHGVLGKRWVYDGVRDPVLVTQLLALLRGRAEPQAQNVSDTPDPSVVPYLAGPALPDALAVKDVADGPDGTGISVESAVAGPAGAPEGAWHLRVVRALRPDWPDQPEQPDPQADSGRAPARGHVTAGWRLPDGGERRGVFAAFYDAAP